MSQYSISVAKDFTRFPAGRLMEHGPFTGEEFRVKHLVPALNSYDSVTVDFDGTLGFGSSFLEEAFGGLIRNEGFSVEELRKKLRFKGGLPSDVNRCWDYIESAGKVKSKSKPD